MSSKMKAPSLRLLLPPLRLLTAAAWQAVQQQSVEHYGKLEELVLGMTEAVPELLTGRQRGLLLLALRAKVILSNPADGRTHLEKIRSVSAAAQDEQISGCCSTLLALTTKLTKTPADSQRLLQEVFNQSFDSALQSLVSDFLSRIEQLFPVPNFREAASWLHYAPGALEESLQQMERNHLTELLTDQSCRLGLATTTVGNETEEMLLSAWSHPLLAKPAHLDPADQSESAPLQPDIEMVKVAREEQQEVVICQKVLEEEQAVSNQSSEGSGVTSAEEGGDRVKGSLGADESQSESSSLRVNVSHTPLRLAHRCPVCGKCFIYRSQVIRHLRTNKTCGLARKLASGALRSRGPGQEPRPVPSYTCFQCGCSFRTRTELTSHPHTEQSRPAYRCDQCGRAFHHLSSLTNHKQTHQDESSYTCDRCGRTFESPEERDEHSLQHRLPDLSCSACAQTFSSQSLLLRHLQTHAAQGEACVYRCVFCEQSFSGVTQLRIHQRTHSFRSHQCDQCSKAYSSATGLQSHRATHAADSRYLCPQCGKCFKTRDGLEGHLRTHSGERPFCCAYCPKRFTALAGLNVHVRRHTGERPYVCSVCGKAWPSGGDLQKHMRTHTGERPYLCQECGKGFSISCHLTEHRRIHTGEKPYACPECGKCFRRRFDLNKHLLSHNSVRPHACTVCSKSYTRLTHLNRHLLTHAAAGGQAEKEAEPAATAPPPDELRP